MQLAGADPDFVTNVSVLSALGLGLWLHRFVSKREFRDNIKQANMQKVVTKDGKPKGSHNPKRFQH